MTGKFAIAGGLVLDGSGGAPVKADILVAGSRIEAIGAPGSFAGLTQIDAAGLAVAPGFINLVSYAGPRMSAGGIPESDMAQGVTLEVIGEGGSLFPTGDFPDYAALSRKLTGSPLAVNIAAIVDAGTIADAVSDTDEDAVVNAAGEALGAGAHALSIALLYPPASAFSQILLRRLFRLAHEYGKPVFAHSRYIGSGLRRSIVELIALAEAADTRLVIANFKVAGRNAPGRWDAVRQTLDRARERGVDVSISFYPYDVAATSAFFGDPQRSGGFWSLMRDPRELRFLTDGRHFGRGARLGDVADRLGLRVSETFRLCTADPYRDDPVAFPILDEATLREQSAWPHAVIASDDDAVAIGEAGTATHPRCLGTFARHIARSGGGSPIDLAEAVRRLTSLPADILGLRDRGRIVQGAFADLVIFDPAEVRDRATFGDPRQAVGLRQMFVNGQLAWRGDGPTPARAGKFL